MSVPSDPDLPTAMSSTPLRLERLLRTDVLILVLIFVVVYFSRLSNFELSIDDEFGIVRQSPNVWIVLGRWAAYLIERLLVRNSVVPFFPIMAFGIALTISYRSLLTAMGVSTLRRVHYLTFPVFVAFPTWSFLTAFAPNIPGAALGHLTAVYAAIYFNRTVGDAARRARIGSFAIAVVCLAVSLGCYQAFAFSFLAVALVLLVVALLRETLTPRSLPNWLGWMVLVSAAGAALYKLGDWIARALVGMKNTAYLDVFANWHALFSSPYATVKSSMVYAGKVYLGYSEIYGVPMIGVPLLMVAGFAGVALSALPGRRKAVVALAVLVLCACPFFLELTSGGTIPTRVMVAVPVVVWCMAMLGLTSSSRYVASAALFAVILTIVQTIYVVNVTQMGNQLARVHDELLSASIYSRIVAANGNGDAAAPIKVDFYGGKEFASLYPRPASSSWGSSFFAWDGGNQGRILTYMRIIGYDNLVSADTSQRKADLTVFSDMPSWPAAGSVRVVGDTTLIKLGKTPGWPYNVP